MEHKFVYPIVRPIPRREIDAAPAPWPSPDGHVAASASALSQRRPSVSPGGARVHAFAQPPQTPRMQVW
jgi:hypothetical protein